MEDNLRIRRDIAEANMKAADQAATDAWNKGRLRDQAEVDRTRQRARLARDEFERTNDELLESLRF